jgi:hypothetical protein
MTSLAESGKSQGGGTSALIHFQTVKYPQPGPVLRLELPPARPKQTKKIKHPRRKSA